jgi:serine/threonine protein kinase
MQLIVNGQQYKDPTSIGGGGEGDIFALNTQNVAKVYQEQYRTDERKQKVLALCDSYNNYRTRHGNQLIAFPEFPAYELAVSFDTLAGFSMTRYSFPTIDNLGYSLADKNFTEANGFRFNDSTATAFIYELCAAVEQLHQSRIVLGDINPGNVMYDAARRKPVIIDIDACRIGSFPCWTTHPIYKDPQLDARGIGLGGALMVDFGTDIFALAVMCFEFLIGALPHFLHLTPPKKVGENKALGISSIKCLTEGRDYLKQHGVSYLDSPENAGIERRINEIKTHDPRLYAFFEAVFV